MNEIQNYRNQIERRLRLDRKTRQRIMADFGSDLQSRLDAGQTLEQIKSELGGPEQVAAEFNEAFAGQAKAYKKRRRWLVFATASALSGAILAGDAWFLTVSRRLGSTVGIIGGADGPTTVFVTGPDGWQTGLWGHLAGLAGLFLLLGWCRGHKRRLWAPILLGAAGALHWIAYQALLAAEGVPLGLMQNPLAGVFTSGTWLCLVVLAWSIRELFRAR